MYSDRLFVVDAQRAAELQARHSPVYFYQFDFYDGGPSLQHIMSNTDTFFGGFLKPSLRGIRFVLYNSLKN